MGTAVNRECIVSEVWNASFQRAIIAPAQLSKIKEP